ncbi:phosphatase PAP2 family protein [Flavitalea flava]
MISRFFLPVIFTLVGFLFITGQSLGQHKTDSVAGNPLRPQVYTIKKSVDIPLTVATAAWTFYGFAGISKKDGSNEAIVNSLQKSDINGFDRWAVRPYSKNADKISYIPFFVAMPLPLLVFTADKKLRKDFLKLTFLYTQAMAITGVFYTSSVHYFYRYRPFVYSSESPLNERVTSNARNSFFAGHVALVATSSFFIAQVLADYHPDSKLKWVYYGSAGVLTAATAYLRLRAGEHFPSDILVGTTIGTLTGWLTPKLHKTKLFRDQKMSILPYGGLNSHGFAVLYKL